MPMSRHTTSLRRRRRAVQKCRHQESLHLTNLPTHSPPSIHPPPFWQSLPYRIIFTYLGICTTTNPYLSPTAIRTRIFHVPSEPWRQAGCGCHSTAVGDHAGSGSAVGLPFSLPPWVHTVLIYCVKKCPESNTPMNTLTPFPNPNTSPPHQPIYLPTCLLTYLPTCQLIRPNQPIQPTQPINLSYHISSTIHVLCLILHASYFLPNLTPMHQNEEKPWPYLNSPNLT